MDATTTNRPPGESFLPDFCNIRIVFSVVIIAQLLAFVLALATPSNRGGGWAYLSLISLYIQWIALLSTAMLCGLRPQLAKLNETKTAIVAFVLLLLITLVLSEITFRLDNYMGLNGLGIRVGHAEFLGRNLAICAIASFLTLRYFYIQHQLKLNIEAENQYRLLAMQARIRPHFLFNALNTIASLIRRQPKRAEKAVEDLSDLFRHTLNEAEAKLPFSTEVEIAQRYLQMEQLRLGERLTVEWDIKAIPANASLPSLTLQPLLENAICHGIEPLSGGGTIRIIGQRSNNQLRLTISNPLATDQQRKREGLHIAVDNIHQRLQAHFKENGRLINQQQRDSYQAELHFPYEPQQQ